MSLVKFKLGINQEDTAFVSIKSSECAFLKTNGRSRCWARKCHVTTATASGCSTTYHARVLHGTKSFGRRHGARDARGTRRRFAVCTEGGADGGRHDRENQRFKFRWTCLRKSLNRIEVRFGKRLTELSHARARSGTAVRFV